MTKPDYATWPTKQQAADAIGVSTKLIEQFTKEKKIESAKWKRPEGGAWFSVYNPDDVNRLRTERNPDAPPFVLPAEHPDPEEGTEHAGVVAIRQSPPDFVQALAAAFATASENSRKHGVRIVERLFLTIAEASDYSGLPQAHLRRLMTEGTLTGVKTGGGWRIKRTDLEKL